MKSFLFLLILFPSINALALNQRTIQAVTEVMPPYNFIVDDVTLGIAPDILGAMQNELSFTITVDIYPWARSYKMASHQPNVLIYSIAKNKLRHNKFLWVGEVAGFQSCVFGLNPLKQTNIQSANNLKGQVVGVMRGGVHEESLLTKGFEIGKELLQYPSQNSLLLGLLHKNVDVIVSNMSYVNYVKKYNLIPDSKSITTQFCLSEQSALHFAFSQGTSPDIVEEFRQTLRQLKTDGTYDRILSRYQ